MGSYVSRPEYLNLDDALFAGGALYELTLALRRIRVVRECIYEDSQQTMCDTMTARNAAVAAVASNPTIDVAKLPVVHARIDKITTNHIDKIDKAVDAIVVGVAELIQKLTVELDRVSIDHNELTPDALVMCKRALHMCQFAPIAAYITARIAAGHTGYAGILVTPTTPTTAADAALPTPA